MDKKDFRIKLIIAGTRSITHYDLINRNVNEFLREEFRVLRDKYELIYNPELVTIISGGAKGVDELGERYAKEHDYQLVVIPAEWDTYGKSAGPIRNEKMAEMATCLCAFWDGESRGTKHMIDTMVNLQKRVKVIRSVIQVEYRIENYNQGSSIIY